MIVYKVVRISRNEYVSLHTINQDLVLRYKINETTTPLVGPIFAHNSIERSFQESTASDKAGLYRFRWAILECEAREYGIFKPRSAMLLLRPFEEILTLENARLFWGHGEIQSHHEHEVQTRDTILCSWVKPIRVCMQPNNQIVV